jgi:hypothetical protein
MYCYNDNLSFLYKFHNKNYKCINKHFSKSDKLQDFHMIVDDDPVVEDESIKFSFNNVNNEVC